MLRRDCNVFMAESYIDNDRAALEAGAAAEMAATRKEENVMCLSVNL